MTTVFISSTGRDLADYREATIDTCLRLGLHPIAMENFESMPVGVTEGSKRQLERADLYVGIFAYRYGYIEDGYDRSVTEIEFDYAGERGIERLCFLVDPTYPWPPDAIDYGKFPRLNEFKQRINNTLIRAQFTTVSDFTIKLTQGLANWSPNNVNTEVPPDVRIAPPRPSLVIGRETDLSRIKSHLIAPDKAQKTIVIRGWPGVGKTTLVTALTYDSHILSAFPDGVLWANVGENSDPFSELAAWGRALGLLDIGKTLEEAIEQMRAFLQHKRMLIIVDDIWRTEDWYPFQVAGPECATLITTQFSNVARAIAMPLGDIYILDGLNDVEALELLQQLAPTVVKQFPKKSLDLVHNLEGLPLAIRVAGRVLEAEAMRSTGRVIEVMDELLQSINLIDRVDHQTDMTSTIQLLFQRTTDRLDAETRDHFAFLGVFAPKPATFDIAAMKAIWMVTDPLPSIRKLVDMGLLETIPGLGRFQLHSIVASHARSLLE